MAKYRYEAINEAGMRVRGEMVVHDEMTLFQNLKDEGMYLIRAKIVKEKHSSRTLSSGALADFCRELGMLTRSGVPLVRALGIIFRSDSHAGRECAVYAELLRRIRQGQLLSDAMESMGTVFPAMLIYMFRVAESGISGDGRTLSKRAPFSDGCPDIPALSQVPGSADPCSSDFSDRIYPPSI